MKVFNLDEERLARQIEREVNARVRARLSKTDRGDPHSSKASKVPSIAGACMVAGFSIWVSWALGRPLEPLDIALWLLALLGIVAAGTRILLETGLIDWFVRDEHIIEVRKKRRQQDRN